MRHAITMINTIANAHICLLNDSISRAFALISSVVPLSPDGIKKLEDTRDGWQQVRSHHFSNLLLMTKLVAIGVILEGPELVYEIVQLLKRWRKKSTRDHPPGVITIIGLIGWALVSIGVAGEFWVDSWVNTDDDNIQSINIQLLRDAGTSASAAAKAATAAHGEADAAKTDAGNAKTDAGDAKTLARGARTEAHALTGEIASAKQQAADAVSRLADAEQRLADSTQREAAAEAKLSAIKTPRSLIHTDELITALKPFIGTEYILNVSQDDESIQFTKVVAKALDAAGWVRKQPTAVTLGTPTLGIVLSQDKAAENVPVCVETGIQIHIESTKSRDAINATIPRDLPKTIQAAILLRSSLPSDITPPEARNVAETLSLDSEKVDGKPMLLCIGRKP